MNDSKKKNQVVCVQIDEPTGLMGTQFALNIAQGVLDAIEEAGVTKSQMFGWDQKDLRLLSKRITKKFLGLVNTKKNDPWSDQKKKVERFYKSIFNFTIDWSKVKLPVKVAGFDYLEYVLPKLTEDDIFNAYAKKFGKDKVWKYCDNIHKAIKEQQSRPSENYTFSHRGGIEPDVEHLNKGYDDFYQDGNNYMVPKEGLISAFRYRFETGNMWDIKGLTLFHSFVIGNVLGMRYDVNGQFSVYHDNCDHRCPDFGPRQINF